MKRKAWEDMTWREKYSPDWRLSGFRVMQREPRPKLLFDFLCWIECKLGRKIW